jgi:hypothetical protein
MDLTEGSETSAKHNLTPGKYPKENIQDSEHGENLKSRKILFQQGINSEQSDPQAANSLPDLYQIAMSAKSTVKANSLI